MDREHEGITRDEFANAARMMCTPASGERRCSKEQSAPPKHEALAAEMRTILGEHRRLWTARNRAGGLQDSERVFEERLREYTRVS